MGNLQRSPAIDLDHLLDGDDVLGYIPGVDQRPGAPEAQAPDPGRPEPRPLTAKQQNSNRWKMVRLAKVIQRHPFAPGEAARLTREYLESKGPTQCPSGYADNILTQTGRWK